MHVPHPRVLLGAVLSGLSALAIPTACRGPVAASPIPAPAATQAPSAPAGSLVWLALLAANLVRGPSCETRFSTPAHDDIVAPLSRTRSAHRVIAMLRPRILAAQAGDEPPVVSPATGDTAP